MVFHEAGGAYQCQEKKPAGGRQEADILNYLSKNVGKEYLLT